MWSKYGGQRAVVLVDETKLADRFGVMLVSLADDGRAIPLWWRCYVANDAQAYPQQGQVLLIYGLLAHVLSALPEQARPLVEMDRGLAHSSARLRVLQSLHVNYLVRVKATARFTSRNGGSQLLKHWVRPGQTTYLRGTLFARDHACTGHLCLIGELGQSEAWGLFTNRAGAIGYYYALRCWQEESFRDLKSGGWHWSTSHLACPERMDRLLFVMALAYAFTLTAGVIVWRQPARLRAETATPDELPRLSLFRLGLRYLRRIFADVTPFPVLTLDFPAPALFVVFKTVPRPVFTVEEFGVGDT